METELKLLIEASAVRALRRHPAIGRHAAGPPHSRRLLSVYLDTPDGRLRRLGWVWRLRRVGRGWVQTVKGEGAVVSGLHHRPEWECPVRGPNPDYAALAALPGAAEALPAELATLAGELAPVFRTEFRRSTWMLELPGGARAELALDEGSVGAGGNSRPICELELELVAGEPVALFDFALEVARGLPLRPGAYTKAERGFALVDDRIWPAVKARPPVLAADASLEQAFAAIVGECLAQIAANEAGLVEGGDADCLHQMRVGLRRLRTALRLFRRWIALPPELQDGIASLAATLGPARDAEVLADDTLAPMAAAAPDETLAPLVRSARTQARRLQAQARAALMGGAHTGTWLAFGAWLAGRRWRDALDEPARGALDAPLADAAHAILARCRKRLAGADPGAGGASVAQRHAVRIAAKRLRYAIEFFASRLPAARTRRALERLAALQDLLGRLNDVAVADAALRDLARRRPAQAEAAAFARGWLAADARAADARWPGALADCLAARPPWKRKA